MNRCISIFGPTASGKSSLGFRLAKEKKGTIISADSMQIYRGLDIGTAKPEKWMLNEVPHRLIDICDPNERFSVYDYKMQAEDQIERSLENEELPIVVGGTGLYLDALFFNTRFGEFEIDEAIRKRLRERSDAGENPALLEELRKVDPESAVHLHEKDSKRILRALEVYLSTGKTLTYFKNASRQEASKFHFCKFYLCFSDRQALYNRINQRVDEMVSSGVLAEAEKVWNHGTPSKSTAEQAIGYKEFFPYFEGTRSLEDCISILKQRTRNYAKRQITWFKRYEDAHVIQMDGDEDPFAQILAITNRFLEE